MKARLSGSGPGLLVASLVVASLAAAACSGGRGSGDPFASPAQDRQEGLVIQVHNRNFNDASVYALSGGGRRQVGTVPSNSNRTYTIAWPGGPSQLQAEISLFGGRRFVTPPVQVRPSDRVRLVVEARLEDSYLQR